MNSQQLDDRHQLEDLARVGRDLALCGWVVRLEPHAPWPAASHPAHLVVSRRCFDMPYLLVRVGRQIEVLIQRDSQLTAVGTGLDADDVSVLIRQHRTSQTPHSPLHDVAATAPTRLQRAS